MEERVLESMRSLGFTASAGRAYVALLRESPATGYELSARSGVPRSAIYGVLRQLEADGLVAKVEDKPARFAPLSADRLVTLLRSRTTRSLDELERGLADLPSGGEVATVWRLRGYERICERAAELIDGAQEAIFLSAWSLEADRLAGGLLAAKQRGVRTVLFSFCSLPEGLGRTFSYGLAPERLREFWTPKLVLVVDRTLVLMGGAAEDDEATSAVVAAEPDVVDLATSQIAMDITFWAWRKGQDVSGVMLEMLHEKVGRLDALLEENGFTKA